MRTGALSILSDIDADRDCGSQGSRDPRIFEQLSQDILTQLDPNRVFSTLSCQLSMLLLDELYDDLWLIARKETSHIDSLHYQLVKGRSIVLNEESKMHLLWTSDRIHVKPIPLYLLNYHFWKQFLCLQTGDALKWRAVAIGFLRSYAYLVRHRSDLNIAHDNNLIPKDVDWEAWTLFSAYFRRCPNSEVEKRYLYGQMRLSRLNHLVRLRLPHERDSIWFYEPPYWSTGPYLRSITTSLGFLLATISLMLSSMQVSLNAGPRTSASVSTFSRFSTFLLVVIGVVWLLLFVVPFAFLMWQLGSSLRQRHR